MKKRYAATAVKFAILVAIVVWLALSIDREQLAQLRHRPIKWWMLSAGFAAALVAVCASFLRWFLLVRALDLPFRLGDAFRLGFVAYLLNFVGVGSVGGDLYKAFFIAREQRGRRTEAVATVILDRMIGMFALLLVASTAILISDASRAGGLVGGICNLTLLATALGAVAIVLALSPRFGGSVLLHKLNRIPKVGAMIGRLAMALAIYRRRLGALTVIGVLGLAVHTLLAASIHLVASSILDPHPTLGQHFVLVPLALVAAGLPFTPGGLGTFEVAMSKLYWLIAHQPEENGLIVALMYRLITIAIALVAVVYYWIGRREVQEFLAEADRVESATAGALASSK